MLTDQDRMILNSFPPEYETKALRALARGKAFCPACHMAGMMNCHDFVNCGSAIFPSAKGTE